MKKRKIKKTEQTSIYLLEELQIECDLFGEQQLIISFYRAPNWFKRLMTKILFGSKWTWKKVERKI